MSEVPLFPLNAVLFPGVATSLHIFEERYRDLVTDLQAIADPKERLFTVVAIREGYEVGDRAVQSLHRVGTLVQLTEVTPLPEGRFDIEITGRQRAVLHDVDTTDSYLRAEVDPIPEPSGAADPAAEEAAARALDVFERYRLDLSELRGGPVLAGPMPTDPTYLSYSLAATCLLTTAERQRLLEAPSTVDRLLMLEDTLHAELRAMRAIPSLPATEVARTRWSPN